MKMILFASMLLGMLFFTESSVGKNYASLTDSECMEPRIPFPDQPCEVSQLTGRDTIWGDWRTNDCIATVNSSGIPVFFGSVISAQSGFCEGSPEPAGQFNGGPPVFNAPIVEFPDTLTNIRERALARGTYLYVEGHEWYCSVRGASATFYHYPEGTPLDTLDAQSISIVLTSSTVVFVDGKLDMRGVVSSHGIEVVFGCSRDIRLIDNVMLQGTNMINGTLVPNTTSRIALASERSIIIGNTWENGRDNKGAPPPNNRDIVITALMFAVGGSFTFEQQNDEQEPYNCDCNPDERGNIVLTGAIAQRRRGYVHRTSMGGTGYNKVYHFDDRLEYWPVGVFDSFSDETIPDSFAFADSPVGIANWDTVVVTGYGPFSGALATTPFHTNAPYEFYGPSFRIPVSFTPPAVGPWYGALTFFLHGEYHSVVLRGNGVTAGGPQIVSTEIVPNPFNVESRIQLELAGAGHLRAIVYDILGREVARLADAEFAAGRHTLRFDGSSLASGVYFLNLQTPQSVMTRKLLLLK